MEFFFARYIYTDDVELKPDLLTIEVLHVAKKFDIPALVALCRDKLDHGISKEIVFTLLQRSIAIGEENITKNCIAYIGDNSEEMLTSEAFLEIDKISLREILKSDVIDAPELLIYNAAVRWAEAECVRRKKFVLPENIRSVLDDCLSLIRFPTMSMDEFADHVSHQGVLKSDQVSSVFQYRSCHIKPDIEFPTLPRMVGANADLQTCNLFKIGGRQLQRFLNDHTSSTDMHCSKDIYMYALHLISGMTADNRCMKTVTVHIMQNSVTLCNTTISPGDTVYHSADGLIEIQLPAPIKIRAQIPFTIKVTYSDRMTARLIRCADVITLSGVTFHVTSEHSVVLGIEFRCRQWRSAVGSKQPIAYNLWRKIKAVNET